MIWESYPKYWPFVLIACTFFFIIFLHSQWYIYTDNIIWQLTQLNNLHSCIFVMVQFSGWRVYIGEEFAICLMLDISKKYLHQYHKMEFRSLPNVIYQFCSSWTRFCISQGNSGRCKKSPSIYQIHLFYQYFGNLPIDSLIRHDFLHQYWNGIDCVTEYIKRTVCSSLQEFTYLWKYASSCSSRSLKTEENILFIHSHKHSWFRLFNMT